MSDFGLREALGGDDYVKLIRRQRETARRYGEHEVVARQTAWLVENGHEDVATPTESEAL